jgi:ABC-type nickel/cobalt efflux system permease component RcnA
MMKNYLLIGFKRLLVTLFLMFIGPTVLFQAFKNDEHEWYLIVLTIGLIICATAIFTLFSGIMSIIKHIFEKDL